MGTSVMQNQDNRLPFAMGTRRRVQTVGSYTITPGNPVQSIVLPQVGYLSRIFLMVDGTITQAAQPAVLSPLGHAALFPRVRVNANLGSASIVDASAYGIELTNRWYAPNCGPVKNSYATTNVGANRFKYSLVVPINANDRTLLQMGLINLQAEQTRVTLDVTTAALSAFILSGGGALSSSLTLTVAYEYWDVPNPMRYQQPPATLCRTLEEQVPITTTGEQIYLMPRLGTLAQVSEYFIINAALADLTGTAPQITEFKVRANKTDTWLDYSVKVAELTEQIDNNAPNGSFLTAGARYWNFFASGLQTRNFGDRDLINTEQITTLEFIASVDSAVVPSTNSTRNVVRRVFQRLV